MIIEISLGVIAAVFVVLAIIAIILVKHLCVTLREVDQTLIEVRKQLNETGSEVKQLMEQSGEISLDLKDKLEALDSLFNAAANVGEVLELRTEEVRKSAIDASFAQETFRYTSIARVADVLELAGLGIRLWQKLKNRR